MKNYIVKSKKFLIAIGVLAAVIFICVIATINNIEAAKYTYITEDSLPNGYVIKYTTIEVQNGDTVYDIATAELNNEEHSTNKYVNLRQQVSKIIAMNNLTNDGKITTGKNIVVPYIVKE